MTGRVACTREIARPERARAAAAAARVPRLLALQRSAGNRAVRRSLERRTLQRLTKEQVKSAFEGTWASNADAVTDDVVETIVRITTEWERRASNHFEVEKRRYDIDVALINHLERYLGKELPSPNDTAYWAERVGELVASLGPQRQMPLGRPKGERVPLAERPVIHCTMGQGVIANLGRYSLYSDQFSSCSPVVMFNAKTLMAGLFHYGAGSRVQESDLKAMHDKIEPTLVALNRRPKDPGAKVKDYSGDDFESLSGFFVKELKTKAALDRIAMEGSNYGAYLSDRGELKVEGGKPAGAGEFDATNIKASEMLNPEVALLVNPRVYTTGFATGLYL